MNKIRHCLWTAVLLFAASPMAFAAGVVEYRKQPLWTLENYLTNFLVKVPMSQARPVGGGIELSGEFVVKFVNMPDDLKAAVQTELMKAFAGERAISGALIDARQAQIRFENGAALLDQELTYDQQASAAQTAEEDSRVVRGTVDMDAIRRQVEDRQRWENLSGLGCSQFLIDIDK